MKVLVKGTCKGIRTCCVTGKVTTVDIQWKVRQRSDDLQQILYLLNGPTGYENVYIDDLFKSKLFDGWCACAGTKGRWDTLEIPKEEMRKIIESI